MIKFLFLLLILLPIPAFAANCGPGQPNPVCQCGDTVVGAYQMPASLVCPGQGLRMGNGADLNCNDRSITGSGAPETYGIYFAATTDALVRKCFVSGFDRGIRFNNAHRNLVKNSSTFGNGNTTLHTGYGIDFAGGSSVNRITNVQVYGNADEGIHIGSGAHGNVITGGQVCGNFRENLYVLENRDTEIVSVVAGHDCFGYTTTGNSLYLKSGVHTYLKGTTFNKNSVHVTGASIGTLFLGNIFNTTYKEDCYAPEGTCPSGTLFLGELP